MTEIKKILVADCDAENLISVSSVLKSLGYDVIQIKAGKGVSAKIRETLPDVILFDTTGILADINLIRELKTDKTTGSIPLIMMTDHSDTAGRQKALAMGVDDFLTKPIEKTEIETRIASALKVKAFNDRMSNYSQDIENEVARRTKEMTKSLEKIKIASLDTVYRLSRAAEYKDEDTGAHVQRMSHYSSAVARAMGLTDDFIENILWAAPMHDIGKIGIPDRVLLKPGKLDADEWIIMKTHTNIGAEILKDSDADFIRLAAEIALTHHEKWDGNGYPKGLKGEDIPLAGRIVAVADVFDALTSERPYKSAFPTEKALSIISEGRGSHFDPHIADAFFSIQNEIEAELNWWKFISAGPVDEKSGLSGLFQ